jgi:uncharacterized protein
MSKPWPEFINPLRLANQGVEFNGSYPLSALDRLVPQLQQAQGEVSFRFCFTKDIEGRQVVKGSVVARLCLTCQRCLMPLWFPVDREVFLGIVEDLAAADHLPVEMDPLLVEGDTTSVRAMVEDELILALPVVAMHERADCTAGEILELYDALTEEDHSSEEKLNPFAALRTFHPD